MSNINVYKWSTIDRVASTILTMGGNIVMARMLSVYDFSLLAMVAIFTAVAYNLSSCGMSDWLIREPDPTEEDYSTVFVFNTSLGLLFGVILFFSGESVAEWFKAPELVQIMRAIGICFFFGTMTFVQEARLRKLLDMRTIALVKICATSCAVGFGIWLAWAGFGYWGLVSCRIFLSVFIFIFYIVFARWFPRIQFNIRTFRQMFRYGVNLLLSYLCTQIANNINTMVLGKASPNDSGLYSQAQKMEEVPFNITTVSFINAFFPVVANERDYDRQRLLIREMGVNILLITFTLMLFMFVVAPSAFITLFGHKWDEAIPIFRVILAVGFLMNIKQFVFAILKFHGCTRHIRDYTVVEVILQLTLLALVYRYGVLWIAASQVFASALTLIPLGYYFRKYEPGSLSAILKEFLRSLYAPVAALVIVLLGQSMWHTLLPAYIDLAFSVVIFAGVFWVVSGWIDLPVYVRLRKLIRC